MDSDQDDDEPSHRRIQGTDEQNRFDFNEPALEEEVDDLVDDESEGFRRGKSPNMAKFLLIIVLLPSLVYCAFALNDILTKYSITSRWLHLFAIIFGGAVATLICLRIQLLRSNLVVIIPVTLAVMLLPSYQVYRCSPLHLENSELGKLYKLKMVASLIDERTYLSSTCFRNTQLQAPYSLSLYKPSIRLIASIKDIVYLFVEMDDSEDKEFEDLPQRRSSRFYLARSYRIVRGRTFSLHMLLRVHDDVPGLDSFQSYVNHSKGHKEKIKFELLGTLKDLDTIGHTVRDKISSKEYIVRPVMFIVSSITEYKNDK